MSDAMTIALLTSLFGLLVAVVSFLLQYSSSQRMRRRDKSQQVKSIAAILAGEMDHARGLVRAFQKSSKFLATEISDNDLPAFKFINRYREAYDDRAELSRLHAFNTYSTEFGRLPPTLVTRLFATYAQFDRIANLSRYFWSRYNLDEATSKEIAYFSGYMVIVYDRFLDQVNVLIEELIELSDGGVSKEALVFSPTLNFDAINAAGEEKQAKPI